MAILKPEEIKFNDKKINMIIAGFPGIGKTTLALSAPSPLLIDVDRGVDRVNSKHRVDTIIANTYEEILNDLQNNDLSSYKTIVIDTGGKMLDIIKEHVIKENPKNGQSDGTLSLKGYGAAGRVFNQFVKLCNSLDKHLVVVFHAKEDKDNEMTKLRILIDGQTKDNIWQYMDLGGFIEIIGKKRTIGFTNCERYFAKGVHGISGIYEIPNLDEADAKNDFLTNLFANVIDNIVNEQSEYYNEKEVYDKAMEFKNKIDKCETGEDLNKCLEKLKKIEHALTSEKELKRYLLNQSKKINFVFDKNTNQFVEKEEKKDAYVVESDD